MDGICAIINPFLGAIDFILGFASYFTGWFGFSLPSFQTLFGDILGCVA